MSNLQFTDHAIERFVKRHAPQMTMAQARAYLEAHGPTATPVKERTILGQYQWVLPDPKCVLVVKHDPRLRAPVVVTILPNVEVIDSEEDEEPHVPFRGIVAEQEAAAKALKAIQKAALTLPKAKGPIKLETRDRGTPRPAPNPPTLQALPRNPKEQAHLVEIQRLALQRQQEKTRRHLDTVNEQVIKQKTIIRCAIRYLVRKAAEEDGEALSILEAIQRIEPGMITRGFLDPHPDEP